MEGSISTPTDAIEESTVFQFTLAWGPSRTNHSIQHVVKATMIGPDPIYARKKSVRVVRPQSTSASRVESAENSADEEEMPEEDDEMAFLNTHLTQRQLSRIASEANGTYKSVGFERKTAAPLSEEEQARRKAVNTRRKRQQVQRVIADAEAVYRRLLNPQSSKKATSAAPKRVTLGKGIHTVYSKKGVFVGLPKGGPKDLRLR
ncbi:INO80 complex subunit B INO80B [Carpediemonas membranifera]|uniref:INO80 complex subunit B INO80B n=1 Tax=Carpediemonas membranifera TaxID=201153 RepID=A0A8J6B0D3_9EUKA|nr:INO80 complex subunit B INO80B [Carpediemonas membranifera]|eukprot:KAG9390287.1 INO80 complex subunit B INO80B [Carpediemonas membranifera]